MDIPRKRRSSVDETAASHLGFTAMYEGRSQKPLPRSQFITRLTQHIAGAGVLLLVSLAVGMAGYMVFENLCAVDAFLNASMLLGGMGPVMTPTHFAGKVFAGVYALYAGLVFIVSAALVITPLAHRVLHKFHWDQRL